MSVANNSLDVSHGASLEQSAASGCSDFSPEETLEESQNSAIAKPTILAEVIRHASRITHGMLGPFELDGWTFITDGCGFLAVNESTGSGAVAQRHEKVTREILALTANCDISLFELKDFARERVDQGCEGLIQCLVMGVPLDANILNKWISILPFVECKAAKRAARTTQREDGHCLFIEGSGWKLIVAGIKDCTLKYPPIFGKDEAAFDDMLAALHKVADHFNLNSESAEDWQESVWQAIAKAHGGGQ